MTVFQIKNQQLTCEKVFLSTIAAEVGTPVYIYSKEDLLHRAQLYRSSVGNRGLVCFAVKANGSPAILRLLASQGLGADVTSGGELFLALHAGIQPQKIIYSGVGKRRDEMEMALEAGIRALHLESAMEMHVLAQIAQSLGIVAPIAVRVNPDIRVNTHAYDSTGELGHKFGVPRETALQMLQAAQENPWLKPVGIAAHIGSQITEVSPYVRLASYLVDLALEAAASGIPLTYIDAGGGLGINYNQTNAPGISDWVTAVQQPIRHSGFDLVIEPGRSIVGPAGGLLTKVLYTKEQGGKSFLIVDAGLNDLIRPAMYGAYHPVLAAGRQLRPDEQNQLVEIVGPVCETGDFLGHDRLLPPMQADDLLLLTQAGAYGFAMSSNYNGRLRLPEVLVDGDQFSLIRQRQGYESLLDGVQTENKQHETKKMHQKSSS